MSEPTRAPEAWATNARGALVTVGDVCLRSACKQPAEPTTCHSKRVVVNGELPDLRPPYGCTSW